MIWFMICRSARDPHRQTRAVTRAISLFCELYWLYISIWYIIANKYIYIYTYVCECFNCCKTIFRFTRHLHLQPDSQIRAITYCICLLYLFSHKTKCLNYSQQVKERILICWQGLYVDINRIAYLRVQSNWYRQTNIKISCFILYSAMLGLPSNRFENLFHWCTIGDMSPFQL